MLTTSQRCNFTLEKLTINIKICGKSRVRGTLDNSYKYNYVLLICLHIFLIVFQCFGVAKGQESQRPDQIIKPGQRNQKDQDTIRGEWNKSFSFCQSEKRKTRMKEKGHKWRKTVVDWMMKVTESERKEKLEIIIC